MQPVHQLAALVGCLLLFGHYIDHSRATTSSNHNHHHHNNNRGVAAAAAAHHPNGPHQHAANGAPVSPLATIHFANKPVPVHHHLTSRAPGHHGQPAVATTTTVGRTNGYDPYNHRPYPPYPPYPYPPPPPPYPYPPPYPRPPYYPYHRQAGGGGPAANPSNYMPASLSLSSSSGGSVVSPTAPEAGHGPARQPMSSMLEESAATVASTASALNLTELCAANQAANPGNKFVSIDEKQLLAYVSGIEALTGTIQELDEVVQQARPRGAGQAGCPSAQLAAESGQAPLEVPMKPFKTTTVAPPVVPTPDPGNTGEGSNLSSGSVVGGDSVRWSSSESTGDHRGSTTLASDEAPGNDKLDTATSPLSPSVTEMTATTTTESFTDSPPLISSDMMVISRARRELGLNESTTTTTFGMPSTAAATIAFNDRGSAPSSSASLSASVEIQDQSSEDLLKASNDLKTLRKDLSAAAEWLKQTNHTVHSAMLRALQAYVSSIERRIDHQRQLYAQTRSSVIGTKISLIREKVASLLERLRLLVAFKSSDNVVDNRVDGSINPLRVQASPNTPTSTNTITTTSTTAATPIAAATAASTSLPSGSQ